MMKLDYVPIIHLSVMGSSFNTIERAYVIFREKEEYSHFDPYKF